MDIKKMFIKYNKTSAPNRKINFIVIHDTGNKNKGADVEAHFKFFNEADRGASADFFVDDKVIGQFTDYKNEYAWHCGDGKGKNGITNRNSVGIELCVNEGGDYEKAFHNLVELTKFLMKKLDIPIDRVVRHFDVSGKLCPASMADNDWVKWKEFKKLLTVKSTETKVEPPKKYGVVNANMLRVRLHPSINSPVLGLVKKGDELVVQGKAGKWYTVVYNGKIGYVYEDYLKLK